MLELRHEIEHRSTKRIDDALSAKLQACCLNFNDAIKDLFGIQYGLERRLPIALQFVTFSTDQRETLNKAGDLPEHVETFIDDFEQGLTKEEYADPAYRYRVAFVPIAGNRASSADVAVEFVKSDSDEGREINRIMFKEVEKSRYTSADICKMMNLEGFPKFNQYAHTKLWQKLDAKNAAHGFGRKGDYEKTWVWFEKWVERVREHCREQGDRCK